jgi:hypothetical protein
MSSASPTPPILHASTIGIVSLMGILGITCVAVIIHPLWDGGMDEETRLLSHECLSSELLVVRTISWEPLGAPTARPHHQTAVNDPGRVHDSTGMPNGLRERAPLVHKADPPPVPMSAVKPDAPRSDRVLNDAVINQMEASREGFGPSVQKAVPTAMNGPPEVTPSRASVKPD